MATRHAVEVRPATYARMHAYGKANNLPVAHVLVEARAPVIGCEVTVRRRFTVGQRCGNCGEVGHNRRSCIEAPRPPAPIEPTPEVAAHPGANATVVVPLELWNQLGAETAAIARRTGRALTIPQLAVELLRAVVG